MIDFQTENGFQIAQADEVRFWISEVIKREQKNEGEIYYVFCDDAYLLKINQEFLGHDTLTDIISFDYTVGNTLHGEIYISTERVEENSGLFSVSFEEELLRVVIHGILHFTGYSDKTPDDQDKMRQREDGCINLYKSLKKK